MDKKEVTPKKKKLSKSEFVRQAGIGHLNSKEKTSRYLKYIR